MTKLKLPKNKMEWTTTYPMLQPPFPNPFQDMTPLKYAQAGNMLFIYFPDKQYAIEINKTKDKP